MSTTAQAAFPNDGGGTWAPEGGLTKRELFAAMAMQGLLSTESGRDMLHREIAADAVHAAEALVKALEAKL